MRPSSQACWALDQVCGVLAMRMASKAARVSRRNGSTVRGPPSVLSLYCDQTLRRSCSGLAGTGMGKRSPKRTPARPPK